mgnify:CR=1 FL=1
MDIQSQRHRTVRRRINHKLFGAHWFVAALEGVEGGFAIGASIVVALSLAGLDRHLLLITAIIGIIVSGFNSASVKYSSEHYLDELDGREKKSRLKHYFVPAAIEFTCYVAISLLTVLPLILIELTHVAVALSVLTTLILLFIAGLLRGSMLRMNGLRDGLETSLLGIGIIAVGLISGLVTNSL